MINEEIDILKLDNDLKEKYSKETKSYNSYIDKKKQLEKLLKNNFVTENIKIKIKKDINLLDILIDEIKTKKKYKFYIMESTNILNEYKKILNKPIIVDFMNNKQNNTNEKSNIIKKYIDIYNKYYNKNNINEKKNINCPNCNSDKYNCNDNSFVCEDCGQSSIILAQNSSYKDSERINIIPRYTYDRKSHFRDCINQFQGKQVVNINQSVYDDLEKQFILNRLLIGDENTPKYERYKNINKKHIQIFLKETKNSKHYEDINYIYENLTGKKINDISHIERQILEDFDILTDAYDKLYKQKTDINRKSFINSQYVLFQLLRKYNYDVDISQFNILKTSDRQNFHDEVCKELFKYLGWNFRCIF